MKKIFLNILLLSSLYGSTQDGVKFFDKGDYVKAIDIFERLSKEEDSLSQAYLGLIYRHGLGIQPDLQKSLYFYKKSCDNGFKIACGWYLRLK
ncbi:tetratricopeptide repeat protein [Aliarcobacter butzleri]|uniref:tetratricopeptide repeat protein n=1 Tax=Aliarcobacter butzleri TaxID=28197 RepID=UPI001260AA62|nr:SEL1-like repeat protein [Aliarcobacter butzleri]